VRSERNIKGFSVPSVSHSPFFAFSYLYSQVAQFCFPEGITPTCVDSQHSGLVHSRALYIPLSDLEKSDNSFIFLLNTGDLVLYGMCVLHNEPVKVLLLLLPPLPWEISLSPY
jgi:hypothetical protein